MSDGSARLGSAQQLVGRFAAAREVRLPSASLIVRQQMLPFEAAVCLPVGLFVCLFLGIVVFKVFNFS